MFVSCSSESFTKGLNVRSRIPVMQSPGREARFSWPSEVQSDLLGESGLSRHIYKLYISRERLTSSERHFFVFKGCFFRSVRHEML